MPGEERILSASEKLVEMSDEEILVAVGPMLLDEEQGLLTSDDIAIIRKFASEQLERDENLSVADLFKQAVEARKAVKGMDSHFVSGSDGVVVGSGGNREEASRAALENTGN